MQAWPIRLSALEFFFDDLAEDFVVQGEIGVHPLELGVLFFEFLESLQLARLEARFEMSQFFHGCSSATKGSILTKGEPLLSNYEQS